MQKPNFYPTIERSLSSNELLAFVPKNNFNINQSIGGTKILTGLIDKNKQIVWESTPFKWRHVNDQIENMNPLEKREWFLSHMVDEALKVDQDFSIETFGIAWAGPISREGNVIGPNLAGFGFHELTKAELAQYGVPLQQILKERLRKLCKSWKVEILNDADASAVVAFSTEKNANGILLILGTGIGSGIIKDGYIYFGPDDFIARAGEIGHHIVYDEQSDSYSYYGKETKGVILPNQGKPTFMERLAGPAVARRFLELLEKTLKGDLRKISDFLELKQPLENTNEISLDLEEVIMRTITRKAKTGDSLCIDYIAEIGFDIGRALRAFMLAYSNEQFIKQFKLAGSMGQYFGLDVKKDTKEDLFIHQIKLGING